MTCAIVFGHISQEGYKTVLLISESRPFSNRLVLREPLDYSDSFCLFDFD